MSERRETPTGRYTYDLARQCECGHRYGQHLAEGKASEAECTVCDCQGFRKVKRKKNPRRKKRAIVRARKANPFKVFIRAVARRGAKTIFWFDGKHFVTNKKKRVGFSTIGNATVMAKHLISKWPILKRYEVELWSKIT